MAERLELEERMHRLGEAYDEVVPKTPGLELRVMARIAAPSVEMPPKPSWRRELALAGAFIIFVGVLAIGLTNFRALRQPVQQSLRATPTPAASLSATPVPPLPADDLHAAGLTNELVTPLNLQATDQGRTAKLLGGYADSARVVLILNLGATPPLGGNNIEINDDQGLVNGGGAGYGVRSTTDYISVTDAGPHPGSDGLAHLTVSITQFRPGNGPVHIDAHWNFSIALPIHPGKAVPAPKQFPLGRWTGNIEIFELTPTVVHLQLVINGASVPEIGLTTVTFVDPAGQVIGEGCGAGITVSKTQISGPNSPLYHNARVYCEFARPQTAGLYQIRFQGGGGTYAIPVTIDASPGSRASR